MPFIGIPPFGQTVRTVTTITATASQTTFTPTGGYTVGYCDVFYNGVKLVAGSDFTASDGLTVVLTAGATSGAVVEIITYGSVTITDAVRRSGDTFAGAVAINSTLAAGNTTITGTLSATANVNIDAGTLFVDGVNNRVGINNTAPTSALTVTGTSALGNTNITGTLTASANINFDSGTLFVDGTNNRVGINNTAPTSALTVTGNAAFSNTVSVTGNATFSNTVAIGSDYLSPYTGFKNRIINGTMVVAQRTTSAVTTNDSYPVDRWNIGNSTDGNFSALQDSDAPAGFNKSVKFTITAADASVTGTQSLFMVQPIEGYNIADLNWGTANAKAVTLSFWVRSSVTGTFSGSLMNGSVNRAYPFTYTINSANTWEQKSITIAGDTTGTWSTDNSGGILLYFSLGTGSTRLGTAGAWAGSRLQGATGETALVNTLNATWYVTGVQLEKGSTATTFDYRPYTTELTLCQRYYQTIGAISAIGSFYSSTTVSGSFLFPVVMRSAPTVGQTGTLNFTDTGGNYTQSSTGYASALTTSTEGYITVSNFSGITAYRPYWFSSYNSSNKLVTLSAEL